MKHQKTALLAGAVTLILLVSACSQAVFQTDSPAYPTFSLVGAPDRDVTYELRVTGPGMEPITRTGIGPTSGSLTLPVPAGRNRTFELLAENDVYSGVATSSLFAGRENRVRVPMLPGPVFVDYDRTGFTGEKIYQFRDLRVPIVTDGEGDIIEGLVRVADSEAEPSISDLDPILDVAYLENGSLAVLSVDTNDDNPYRLQLFNDFDFRSGSESWRNEIVIGNPPGTSFAPPRFDASLIVGPQNNIVGVVAVSSALGDVSTLEGRFFDAESGDSIEDLTFSIDISDVGLTVAEGETDRRLVQRAIFDSSGSLWLLTIEKDGLLPSVSFTLISLDIANETVMDVIPVPGDFTVPYSDSLSGPYWADMALWNDQLVIVHSATISGEPPVIRFNPMTESFKSWGESTTNEDPRPGEFLGPRRFIATRRRNEFVVVDQQSGNSQFSAQPGRVVGFRFGTTEGWQTFGENEFGFFHTSGS